ncbi:MAG: alpha/beta hydrolase [Kordiimonas sp.]|nr:alpha/beta hydrolase [Kordiimonas sp.]
MFDHLESKYIDVNGIKTHYIDEGEGDNIVVLIHGGGAGADGKGNFSTNVPFYNKAGMRVICPDMVGYGRSDKPNPEEFSYTQEARAEHIAAFIEALGVGPVNLVGNSMGGAAACGATLLRPDLVKSLVLMGAAIKIDHAEMVAAQDDNAVHKYDGTREGMLRTIKALTHSYEPADELVDYRQELATAPGTMEAFIAAMKLAFNNGLYYSGEELGSLKPPVMIITGRDDIMVPQRMMIQAMQEIPHAWGVFMPDCGHWVMIEYPEEFCNLTMQFFEVSAKAYCDGCPASASRGRRHQGLDAVAE